MEIIELINLTYTTLYKLALYIDRTKMKVRLGRLTYRRRETCGEHHTNTRIRDKLLKYCGNAIRMSHFYKCIKKHIIINYKNT